VRDTAVDAICHGADLAASGVVELSVDIKKGDLIALKTLKNEGIAIAVSEHPASKISTMKSGIVAKIERVFMERGRYPSLWKKKDT
jgi:H/ACA ribonucleoprotein complex subunit 4